MRESLLGRDPEVSPVTLAALVGIARTIERESVERYAALTESMERRGEMETAQAFRLMLEEERRHVEAVEHWTMSLAEAAPQIARFEWRLPADLSESWDEVTRSARLTPYRAFAIAVDNEQRAFALYSYLAAAASDPRVAAEAERLAKEELRHAALMRRWRRRAWHEEGRAHRAAPPVVDSIDALHALLAEEESAISARHRAIATRLRAIGDEESAQVLEPPGGAGANPAGTTAGTAPTAATAATVATASAAQGLPPSDDPVHLLVAAQAPLETLGETLEGVLRTTEGPLFAEAEHALSEVVARIARIALQTELRMRR